MTMQKNKEANYSKPELWHRLKKWEWLWSQNERRVENQKPHLGGYFLGPSDVRTAVVDFL